MSGWYIEKGPESDVVISSRVRLARNVRDYPFPFKMNREQGTAVLSTVKDAFFKNAGNAARDYMYMDMQNLNPIDKQILVEKHLISPDMAGTQMQSGVIISRDEKVSIMINEEDHLRIQCLFAGMQMEGAWNMCDDIDNMFEKKIEFAFSDKFGFLTCCPTNIGTGIRASAMLHLPALTMTGYIKSILDACAKLGAAVRGIYGENSEAAGNMFQVSNQVTLGQSESEIIANINNIVLQVIEQERMIRTKLFKQNPSRLEDKAYRSLGIMSNARILTSEETFRLLSDIRLGVDMGIIKDIKVETLNEIMLLIQPANLLKLAGRMLEPEERDIKRAELVRNMLGSKHKE